MRPPQITWLTKTRPKQIEDYWNKEYPEIETAPNKISVIENNGYSLVGYFSLKQNSWLKNYYEPMKNRFSSFLEKHNNSDLAKSIVEESIDEIKTYEMNKDYFSYGFYVAKKL